MHEPFGINSIYYTTRLFVDWRPALSETGMGCRAMSFVKCDVLVKLVNSAPRLTRKWHQVCYTETSKPRSGGELATQQFVGGGLSWSRQNNHMRHRWFSLRLSFSRGFEREQKMNETKHGS